MHYFYQTNGAVCLSSRIPKSLIVIQILLLCVTLLQEEEHTAMHILVLEVDLFSWIMSSVPQVPVNYLNVPAGRS